MGVILSAAYIVAKGSDLLQRIRFLKRSFIKFLQKTVIPQNIPYLRLLITLKNLLLVTRNYANKRANTSCWRNVSNLP